MYNITDDNEVGVGGQDFKRNTRQGYKETQDAIKQNKALQRLLTNRPW